MLAYRTSRSPTPPPSDEAPTQGGPRDGAKFVYHHPHQCSLGRAHDCELRVPSLVQYLNVSRHHCAFDIDPPRVRVRDSRSTNGTYVNGRRLPTEDGECPLGELGDGDEVQAGGLVLRVRVVESPAAASTGASAAPADEPSRLCESADPEGEAGPPAPDVT